MVRQSGSMLRSSAKGVPIREDENQGLVSRHILPNALLVRVQCVRKDLYKAKVKHKTCRPLDDHWVILSASKAFDYFGARRDEIRFASDPP